MMKIIKSNYNEYNVKYKSSQNKIFIIDEMCVEDFKLRFSKLDTYFILNNIENPSIYFNSSSAKTDNVFVIFAESKIERVTRFSYTAIMLFEIPFSKDDIPCVLKTIYDYNKLMT